jgi:hypothetical protein
VPDDATAQRILAVADAGGVVPDGDGGDAEPVEVVEAHDAGSVAPDAGVVEDGRTDTDTGHHPTGVATTVRAGDRDPVAGVPVEPGDAVDHDHRCPHPLG